jgi:hypothetical protein
VLNLLGPHQRISYDDKNEVELKEDEPQSMVKRRCLANIKERIYKLLTGIGPWPVDQIIAEASLEGVVNPAENVTVETRHHEPDKVAIANSIEYVHVVDLEMRVVSSLKPELDNSDDQLSNSIDDASVVVVDDVVRTAGKPKPTKKETTVECVNVARKADGQCITVANEQSLGITTANESKLTEKKATVECVDRAQKVVGQYSTMTDEQLPEIITADKLKSTEKETTIECIDIAQKADGSMVADKQSPRITTADEPKTTSVLHDIKD